MTDRQCCIDAAMNGGICVNAHGTEALVEARTVATIVEWLRMQAAAYQARESTPSLIAAHTAAGLADDIARGRWRGR